LGLVFFTVYKAFRQGVEMKEEQDLII